MPSRPTRAPAAAILAGPVLAGPAVLAFFSGGYFPAARAWAGLIAWALVALAAALIPRPMPRSRAARLALAALLGLTVWTLLSALWAPSVGPAYHAGQLAALYLGVLVATSALARHPLVGRAIEPALLAGAVAVVGYGISERLLPGVLHFASSVSAEGRLEQPLTYWNAMGELAAIGVVLAVRLAADVNRSRGLRLGGFAAAAPLGMGLYLSFSRGALFACLAGLVALAVLDPRVSAWRSGAVATLAAVLGAVAAAPSRGVTGLLGSIPRRETQGAIVFACLAAVAVAAVLAGGWLGRRRTDRRVRLPRWVPWAAAVLIAGGLSLAIVAGAKERSTQPLSPGTARLVSLQSNRYAYWRVALTAFGDEPLRGVGAGGWSVYWLRLRPFDEFANDAHSLELQTLAELGLVGAALLLAWFFATGVAAARAARLERATAAGPIAGLVTYLAHSPLDWDWEMPAVTVLAVVLAGRLLALADARAVPSEGPSSDPAVEMGAAATNGATAPAGPAPAPTEPPRSAAPPAGTPTPRGRRRRG